MATLVLTVAGGAIGGPIGAAIGAVAGQQVDRAVLGGGKGREGPRLTELRVQTSSYGSSIPKLFGTMRVAGTVIWATDLIETRSSSRAGKGQPGVSTYSYAASFAVLLSARPIRAVGRIWAEGGLLRGAAGDWKASTGFRLHLGSEDQAPDPLIASAVGAGLAPAHRGCAYAVFEGLQLADFGNRIPSLTFEVIADDGGMGPGAIAQELAKEVAIESGAGAGDVVSGFAAGSGTVRQTLDLLGGMAGGWWAADAGQVLLRTGAGAIRTVSDAGVTAGEDGARRERSVASLDRVPRTLTVAHYDPARDYQAGVQRARRPGAGDADERVEVPAAMAGTQAKTLAAALLAKREVERTRRTVIPGLVGLAIGPGERVTIEGEPGIWRVVEASVEQMAPRLTLVPVTPVQVSATRADSGQVVAAADLPVGRTLLHAVELPPLDDVALAAPRLAVLAAGSGAGWRRAALLISADDGASWQTAGATAAPTVMGRVVDPPGAGPSTLFDAGGSLVVELAHPGMELTDADDRRLDGGANLAMVGDELLQFGRATPCGDGRWRLSRLLRGRRGTEAAIGTALVGDRFAVLEPDTVRLIDLPLASLGGRVAVMATGLGDEDGPALAEAAVTGASVVPPSPVSLRVEAMSGGGRRLQWRRRSRLGWRWIDGADAPLAEEAERYRVTLHLADGGVREVETDAPTLDIGADELRGGAVLARVRQRGTLGLSGFAEIWMGGNDV